MKKQALEKLQMELEKILNEVRVPKNKNNDEKEQDKMLEIMKQQGTILIRYIMKRCTESDTLCEDVLLKHKSFERCMKYVTEKARAFAVGNVACISDDVVFEWAEDYYRFDDKEEAEKELAKEARKKKEEEKRRKENAEKDKIAREKAIEKLSTEEGFNQLPEEEKEKKIKEETRKIRFNIGTSSAKKKKEKPKPETGKKADGLPSNARLISFEEVKAIEKDEAESTPAVAGKKSTDQCDGQIDIFAFMGGQ